MGPAPNKRASSVPRPRSINRLEKTCSPGARSNFERLPLKVLLTRTDDGRLQFVVIDRPRASPPARLIQTIGWRDLKSEVRVTANGGTDPGCLLDRRVSEVSRSLGILAPTGRLLAISFLSTFALYRRVNEAHGKPVPSPAQTLRPAG